MGCCVSTNNTTPSSKTSNNYPSTKHHTTSSSKSPPPYLEEEAVVKEVLTETPAAVPKKSTLSTFQQQTPQNNTDSPFVKTSAPLLLPNPHFLKTKTTQDNDKKRPVFNMAFPSGDTSDDVYSESVSVWATFTDKKDTTANNEFHEVMARQRSPAKHMSGSFSCEVDKRDRAIGRSPGRRSKPSPGRAQPGNGPGPVTRRDSGESSGRRSRSPVTRTDASRMNLGRTQSGSKTGRVGSGLRDVSRKESGDSIDNGNKWPPTGNESLENPLVSLECFIFV